MQGFDKFQLVLIEATKEHFGPLEGEERKQLGQVLHNHLFDLDGPRELRRTLDAKQLYFSRLFRGFLEISKSLETLDDIAVYVRRFPFGGTRITRERYLQFHVEAHFSEMYILRDRLTRYATFIQRQFKRDPRLNDVQRKCENLNRAITKSLDGVVDVRRRHVHEFRFSDDGIDRLGTIALLSQGENDEFSKLMKIYYRQEHRNVRRKWRDTMKGNLSALREVLNAYFESIFPMVFDEQTKAIRYPSGART